MSRSSTIVASVLTALAVTGGGLLAVGTASAGEYSGVDKKCEKAQVKVAALTVDVKAATDLLGTIPKEIDPDGAGALPPVENPVYGAANDALVKVKAQLDVVLGEAEKVCEASPDSVAPAKPFADCDEVRAAGKAPIAAAEPRFQPRLDPDGDGLGCERREGSRAGSTTVYPGTLRDNTGLGVVPDVSQGVDTGYGSTV